MPNKVAIGVDLGGTKTEVSLVHPEGRVLRSERRPTAPERGPELIIQEIAALIRSLLADQPDAAEVVVGVGVAGQVDPITGTVSYAPNLRWVDFPLRLRLEEAVALPVAVLNDVQAAAVGEWLSGAGEGVQDMVAVFVGTGIGGGIVSHGELLRGCAGSAGELGHMTVDLQGPLCHCGNRGCMEAFAGGWAIAQHGRELVRNDPEGGARLLARAGDDPERITARLVVEEALGGDPLSRRVVERAEEALGAGLAAVVNAFGPCVLVLGGSVANGLPELVDRMRQAIDRRALGAAAGAVRVVRPLLGQHAGVVGAAGWASFALGRTA